MDTGDAQQPVAGATAGKATSPQEIGWLFVPQYYTFVHKDPTRLHCFYTKRSTFVHGLEGEDVQTRHGQQEIHEKILELGFVDCKVYISNVDSQSSADGGIIVQVLGEISNNGGEWRKFAQTFFLAEQPNGYFVLNDIFRYLREEPEDRGPVPGSPAGRIAVDMPSGPEETYPQHLPPVPTMQPPETEQTSSAGFDLHQNEAIARSSAQHQVNGWHHHVEPPAAPAPASQPAVEPRIPTPVLPSQPSIEPPVAPESASQPSAAVEQSKAPETHEVEQASSVEAPVEAPSVAAPVEAAPSTQQSQQQQQPVAEAAPVAAAPPVKKTWANLAASSGAWKTGVSSAARGVSAQAPPAPASAINTNASPPSAPPAASTSQPVAMTPSGRPIPNIAAITHPNCFVKNVQEQVTDEGLRRTLESNFGPIKELDIVRSKACAFLEFKSVESAKRAIHFCSPHSVGGNGGIECDGMFLHIEERKPKGDPTRPSGAPRGGGRVGGAATGAGRGGAPNSATAASSRGTSSGGSNNNNAGGSRSGQHTTGTTSSSASNTSSGNRTKAK